MPTFVVHSRQACRSGCALPGRRRISQYTGPPIPNSTRPPERGFASGPVPGSSGTLGIRPRAVRYWELRQLGPADPAHACYRQFFGFWGLFGKLASIFGLLSLGVLQVRLGLRSSILLCSVFFLAALALTLLVREQRGRAAAAAYAKV